MIKYAKYSKRIAVLIAVYITTFLFPFLINAEETENKSPKIMVSLGDSYSSGEGIEPFFGQDKEMEQKVIDEDWLAHRSEKSWSGLLTLPGIEGTMYDNKDEYWFFKAASGATTDNLTHLFCKEYDKKGYEGSFDLEPQLAVFDGLAENSVSYVTMTMGGNDVDFTGIIQECVIQGIPFTNKNGLSDKFKHTWEEFYANGGTQDKLLEAYKAIESKAGTQAHILIAGYPQLLSKEELGKNITGVCFSENEVSTVNTNVTKFNNALNELITSCNDDGMNIYFVPVEKAFEGHEAYSSDPYINNVIIWAKNQDLKGNPPSAYSIHPNEEGAKAYAACVQAKIDEIEAGLIEKTEAQDLKEKDSKEKDSLQDKVNKKIEKQKQEIAEWLEKKLEEWLNEWLAKNCEGC